MKTSDIQSQNISPLELHSSAGPRCIRRYALRLALYSIDPSKSPASSSCRTRAAAALRAGTRRSTPCPEWSGPRRPPTRRAPSGERHRQYSVRLASIRSRTFESVRSPLEKLCCSTRMGCRVRFCVADPGEAVRNYGRLWKEGRAHSRHTCSPGREYGDGDAPRSPPGGSLGGVRDATRLGIADGMRDPWAGRSQHRLSRHLRQSARVVACRTGGHRHDEPHRECRCSAGGRKPVRVRRHEKEYQDPAVSRRRRNRAQPLLVDGRRRP